MKFFLVFILVFTYIYASDVDVKKLQDSFFEEVVLKQLKSNVRKSLISREERFNIDAAYWLKAKKNILKHKSKFKHAQFISLVDLKNQVFILVLYDTKEFYPIGFDFISSGDITREVEVKSGEDHYFKTPSGLFNIKSGWRSKGELLDDNVTLPYGKKGSFVFYFGEQKSIRYNTFDANGTKIKDKQKHKLIKDKLKFALHTHKSSLEFGVPRSHGCIRISEELNTFLDNNLVFFKHLYKEKKWIHPYKKPPKHPKNYNLAGEFLLVVDFID